MVNGKFEQLSNFGVKPPETEVPTNFDPSFGITRPGASYELGEILDRDDVVAVRWGEDLDFEQNGATLEIRTGATGYSNPPKLKPDKRKTSNNASMGRKEADELARIANNELYLPTGPVVTTTEQQLTYRTEPRKADKLLETFAARAIARRAGGDSSLAEALKNAHTNRRNPSK